MTANGPPAVACAIAFGNGGPGRACGAFVAVLRNHAETSSLKSMVNLLKSAVLPVRVIRSAPTSADGGQLRSDHGSADLRFRHCTAAGERIRYTVFKAPEYRIRLGGKQ